MSGPQGSDPNQPWQPPQGDDQQSGDQGLAWQQPHGDQPGWQQPHGDQPGWQQPHGDQPGWQQPTVEQSAWQQPAYTPTEYSQYQQPGQFYPLYQQPGAYAQPGQYGEQTQYGQPAQYGQPGQLGQYPPGQYGQPGQYPQQPGQYGPPPAGAKRSRAVIGTVIGVFAAIVVAVVLVLGFWQPGFFVTTKLDISKAQDGVKQVLADETNGYGAKNVKDVKCNDGQNPTVKKGSSFECNVSIDGAKRQLTVTFQDNKGTYEVGRPK